MLTQNDNSLQKNDYEMWISNQVTEIWSICVNDLTNSKNTKERIKNYKNFNAQSIISKISTFIANLEVWYVNEHNNRITTVAREENISPNSRQLGLHNVSFIKDSIKDQINSLEKSLKQFEIILFNYANFLDKWTGWKGFANGLVEGFVNPIDGVKVFWGQSSIDNEERDYKSLIPKFGQILDEGFVDLDNRLIITIKSAWSQITINYVNEIRYDGEQLRRAKFEEDKSKHTIYNSDKGQKIVYIPEQNSHQPLTFLLFSVIILLGTVAILIFILLYKHPFR